LSRSVAIEKADLRIVVALFSLEEEAAHIHLFIIPPALCPIGGTPGHLSSSPWPSPRYSDD